MVSTILETVREIPQDEDARYVERFLSGEQGAFEQIYAKYYEKVYSVARGILLDADDAADAVQEIFTQVYKHLANFDRRSKFGTWLFRIAVNRSIQFGRKTKYRLRQTELNEQISEERTPEALVGDPDISVALSQLVPNDRALIVLFYWEEMSLAEIASSLDCSENAAKTRLYRARERFKVFYEKVGI